MVGPIRGEAGWARLTAMGWEGGFRSRATKPSELGPMLSEIGGRSGGASDRTGRGELQFLPCIRDPMNAQTDLRGGIDPSL
jgi:hypothetical protein